MVGGGGNLGIKKLKRPVLDSGLNKMGVCVCVYAYKHLYICREITTFIRQSVESQHQWNI